MPSSAELIAAYTAGAEKLRAAVAGLTPEQFTARPVPGKWSTLEVLAHLADFEPIFADRIKRVLAFDRPAIFGVDDAPLAAAGFYQDRDPAEELAVIGSVRASLARVLAKVPPEAWDRIGQHAEAGPQTVTQLVAKAVRHIEHHLPFIAEKRAAMGV
jgi:uncharacterized damage-inducible protein DinB